MNVHNIKRTELRGMILQHCQTMPEIVFNHCVICFINFDGDIQSVGTRLIDLSTEDFLTLKELIGMIEFDNGDFPDYREREKVAIESIRDTAEKACADYEGWGGISNDDLGDIRKKIIEIELINARKNELIY